MNQETSNVTVRLPTIKQKQIDAIAQRTDRSRNWIINQAIEQYLALYEGRAQQIEAALSGESGVPLHGSESEAGTEAAGMSLVEHWRKHGVIGSRADIADSQAHARQLRQAAETRCDDAAD